MIRREQFLKMFSDTGIDEAKLDIMYSDIPRLYVYAEKASGQMHSEIMRINKLHSEIFLKLDNPNNVFYSYLDIATANRLLRLIEIEKGLGKKSWSKLESSIAGRIYLYKKLFDINSSDIASIEKELENIPSRYSSVVKFGLIVAGIIGTGYAAKKTYDYVMKDNKKDEKK